MAWIRGRLVEADTLRQMLRHIQLERLVDRRGYISVQRFVRRHTRMRIALAES